MNRAGGMTERQRYALMFATYNWMARMPRIGEGLTSGQFHKDDFGLGDQVRYLRVNR